MIECFFHVYPECFRPCIEDSRGEDQGYILRWQHRGPGEHQQRRSWRRKEERRIQRRKPFYERVNAWELIELNNGNNDGEGEREE